MGCSMLGTGEGNGAIHLEPWSQARDTVSPLGTEAIVAQVPLSSGQQFLFPAACWILLAGALSMHLSPGPSKSVQGVPGAIALQIS